MYREIIGDYFKMFTEHISMWQVRSFVIIQQVVRIITTGVLIVKC